MKYIPESETLLLSPAELGTLRARVKVVPNMLSPVSLFDASGGQAADLKEFDSLPGEKQALFLEALKTFCTPECSILWHETVADIGITRSAAAWNSAVLDHWTVASWNGAGIWLRVRSAAELAFGLTKFLAVVPDLGMVNLRALISCDAALTTLAALDYVVQARLLSMLAHSDPAASFTPDELQSRFQEARQEDFRWPLLFMEKLIPVDIEKLAEKDRLLTSLKELTKAGVLVRVGDEEGDVMRDLYMFSQVGDVLRQAFLQEASKVGMRVSALSASGEVGHEVFLFLRDPFYLWMFDLSGQEGAIADVSQADWERTIEHIFSGATV